MKIGILYIATGRYITFFRGFYESMERFFISSCEKEYYVFTDAVKFDYSDSEKVKVIYQENLGWPDNTLKRFEIFNKSRDKYSDVDYLFFFNANLKVVKDIDTSFLPQDDALLVCQHPGNFDKRPEQFPYDRNEKSTAYIPYGEGKHYVAGGLNGAKTNVFLKVMSDLEKAINIDLENGIIAKWHDESQLNKYILGNTQYKLIDPGYLYPEIDNLPFEKKMVLRDKMFYGGHDWMRQEESQEDKYFEENKEPLVTVALCVDSRDYLNDAIESIKNQTYKNIEIIQFGNGKAKGTIDELNYAIKKSNGKYIVGMYSSDISMPGRIKWQIYTLETEENLAGCYIGYNTIDEAGFVVKRRNQSLSYEEMKAQLLLGHEFSFATLAVRRDCVKRFMDEDKVTSLDYGLESFLLMEGKVLKNLGSYYLIHRDYAIDIEKKYVIEHEIEKFLRFCLSGDVEHNLSDFSVLLHKAFLNDPAIENMAIMRKVFFSLLHDKKVVEYILADALYSQVEQEWEEHLKKKGFSEAALGTERYNAIRKSIWNNDSVLEETVIQLKNIMSNTDTLAIYGAGDLGRKIYDECDFNEIFSQKKIRVYDSYIKELVTYKGEICVGSMDELNNKDFDYIIVASNKYKDEMITSIKSKGISVEKIITLDMYQLMKGINRK